MNKNPLKFIWNLISIPMGVLGLLSLSDALIDFHKNIQLIIDSYHDIVYPVFNFIFAWLCFDIPSYIFDYLFLGILFASSERKAWGYIKFNDNYLKNILLHLTSILYSILFWPFLIFKMINLVVFQTHSNGLFKSNDGVKIEYLHRKQDILVFLYLGAAFILFIIILIINYTYS